MMKLLNIFQKKFNKKEVESYYNDGEIFGEISATNFLKSTHYFKTNNLCQFAIINLEVVNDYYLEKIKYQKDNIKSNICQMKYFNTLKASVLKDLAKNLIIYRYPINSLIVEQGYYIKDLYILVSGQIEIVRKVNINGKESDLNIHTIGEFGKILGFKELYNDIKSENSIITSSSSLILSMNFNDFKEIVNNDFIDWINDNIEEYPEDEELFQLIESKNKWAKLKEDILKDIFNN